MIVTSRFLRVFNLNKIFLNLQKAIINLLLYKTLAK